MLSIFQQKQDVLQVDGNGKKQNRFSLSLSRWLAELSRAVIERDLALTIENGADLNNLKTAGKYIGINLTNAPSGIGTMFIEVLAPKDFDPVYIYQRATKNSSQMWIRFYDGVTDTWGIWVNVV